jgi:hypothetical protein
MGDCSGKAGRKKSRGESNARGCFAALIRNLVIENQVPEPSELIRGDSALICRLAIATLSQHAPSELVAVWLSSQPRDVSRTCLRFAKCGRTLLGKRDSMMR